MNIAPIIIAVVLFCAVLGAAGQIFFKLASKNFSFNPSELVKNYYFLIGALLYATSAGLFVWSLKYGNLSLLYPLIATSYIWVVIFSSVILGEAFSSWKWLGIGLIMAGIIVIVK